MSLQDLRRFLLQREAWMADAACKGEGHDKFILERGQNSRKGRAFCAVCPVTVQCHEYAERTGSVGIWGDDIFQIKDGVPDAPQREVRVIEPVILLQDARVQPVDNTSQNTSQDTSQNHSTHRNSRIEYPMPVSIAARKAV